MTERIEIYKGMTLEEICDSGLTLEEIRDGAASGHLLKYMGMDARLWAEEFLQSYKRLRKDKIKSSDPILDEGWLIAWFANAIMKGYDEQRWRMEKRPIIRFALRVESLVDRLRDKHERKLLVRSWVRLFHSVIPI